MALSDVKKTVKKGRTKKSEIKIQVATLEGVEEVVIKEDATIADFRELHNIADNAVITNYEGDELDDDDTLEEGDEIYVTTAKKNG